MPKKTNEKVSKKLPDNGTTMLTKHDVRKWITKMPMKPTHMRWSIAERNQNIGWNMARLYLLETINEVYRETTK